MIAIGAGAVHAHRDGEGPADPASAVAPLTFEGASMVRAGGSDERLSWPHLFDREGRFRSDAEVEAASRRGTQGPSGVTRQPSSARDHPPSSRAR